MKHTSVASGLALAYLSAHAHAFPALITRKDKWENPDGGNTDVQVGDKKINWGSKPPWDALNEIKDHCLSNGCNGDDKLTVKTKILDGDTLDEGDITISIEGTFARDDEDGNIDQLTDLVKAAAARSNYDVKTESYAEGYSCPVGTSFGCDPGTPTDVDQYWMTNRVNVNVKNDFGDPFMNVYVTIDTEEDDGACEDLTTAGSAIAGAFNGMLGGIFTLASLGCE